MNLLDAVRKTSQYVMEHAKDVKISEEAIENLINNEKHFPASPTEALSKIEWDSSGWHYNLDASTDGPLTAQYILVLDALNFCFWPCPGLEYEHLAIGLKDALLKDPTAFDAKKLAEVDEDTLKTWIPGWEIPNLQERIARVQEVGQVLLAEFDGLAANLIKRANHSAIKLVTLITAHFPGFRDTTVYQGRLIHFYKRAQIFVADIWGAYGRQRLATTDGTTTTASPFVFHDIDALTMFADYRVPQILEHVGVMIYSPALQAALDAQQVIPFGHEWEQEIRAATVLAVEMIRNSLQKQKGISLLSVEIDWLLWNLGEVMKDNIRSHHRTLTIYY